MKYNIMYKLNLFTSFYYTNNNERTNELIITLAPYKKLAKATISPIPEIRRIGVTENPSITSKKADKFFDKVHLDFPLLRALRW